MRPREGIMSDKPSRMEAEQIQQGNERLSRVFLRWGVAGIIAVVAVAGGVYTGNALSLKADSLSPNSLTNDSFLDVGDQFPDYSLVDISNGDTVRVSEMASSHGALLVFADASCGVCEYMFQYWGRKVMPKLAEGTRVVVIFDSGDTDTSAFSGARQHLSSAVVATTDRHSQSESDGVFQTPTLIAIDRHNRIKFVCTGFDRRVTADFLNNTL